MNLTKTLLLCCVLFTFLIIFLFTKTALINLVSNTWVLRIFPISYQNIYLIAMKNHLSQEFDSDLLIEHLLEKGVGSLLISMYSNLAKMIKIVFMKFMFTNTKKIFHVTKKTCTIFSNGSFSPRHSRAQTGLPVFKWSAHRYFFFLLFTFLYPFAKDLKKHLQMNSCYGEVLND